LRRQRDRRQKLLWRKRQLVLKRYGSGDFFLRSAKLSALTVNVAKGSAVVPILLGNPSYYGTLAATRSLGRAGVPVITFGPPGISLGRYSRYNHAHMRSPPFEQTERWMQWLFNARHSLSGSVIYATSDAVSYALAKFHKELSTHFLLFQPDLEAMLCLLDKGRLLHHAHAVGIETPETWLPRSRDEAKQIANEVSRDLLVKPRSQLAIKRYIKGALTGHEADALIKGFDQIVNAGSHDPNFARNHPEVMLPMLQVYHPEAGERVYSLSGFRDRTGLKTAILAAVKVMQRPRDLGVGLCFEEAAVDCALASKILSLCERIGYFGVFEAEFIQTGGRSLLIDFNGRFYNQLSLDIARGLDLPRLVYASATGQDDKVDALISAFRANEACPRYAFCSSVQFDLLRRARRSFGSMSKEEAYRWRQWRALPGRTIVDATFDTDDHWPYVVDIGNQIFCTLRHMRGFLRECLA
jgi:D-aspartate ligase